LRVREKLLILVRYFYPGKNIEEGISLSGRKILKKEYLQMV
jgi:hypothetical protein